MVNATLASSALLVAVHGLKGCGKTTLCRGLRSSILHDPRYSAAGSEVVSFAAPLREMLMPLLQHAGLEDKDAFRLLNKDKTEVIPQLGVSVRHLLQTLGTEWGRQCISPYVWTEIAKAKVRRLLGEGKIVLIDDVRFADELAMVQELGGISVALSRRGLEPAGDQHASEQGLPGPFTLELVNPGVGLLQLQPLVDSVMAALDAAWERQQPLSDGQRIQLQLPH